MNKCADVQIRPVLITDQGDSFTHLHIDASAHFFPTFEHKYLLMKKIILLFLLAASAINLYAQGPVPNGGFENWSTFSTGTPTPYSYEMPDNWKTTDSISVANSNGPVHSVSKEASTVQSGTYSMRLQSWSYLIGGFPFINGIPGCATNGDVIVNTSTASIIPVSGSPDTVRHAQLSGFYRYSAGGTGNDSGSIEVCLLQRNTISGNRDTVAMGQTYFHNQGSYTNFSVTINQFGSVALNPDSMLIWIQSSPREPLGSGQTGSILLIDSLSFSGVIGINELQNAVNAMQVYPVPAIDVLNVDVDLKNPIRISYEVIDINGKQKLSHSMDAAKTKIDVSSLSNGNYFVNLLDENGNRLSSGKFTINK